MEWPKAEVFEYDDVIHRDRKREEMTKISASLEVFLTLTLVTLYGCMGLCLAMRVCCKSIHFKIFHFIVLILIFM